MRHQGVLWAVGAAALVVVNTAVWVLVLPSTREPLSPVAPPHDADADPPQQHYDPQARPVRIYSDIRGLTAPPGCLERCRMVGRPEEADAAVHFCNGTAFKFARRPGLKTVWSCWGGPISDPAWDWTAGLASSTTLPITWNRYCADPRVPSLPRNKTLFDVLFIASHRVPWRDAYIANLSQYINVSIFKGPAKNADEPEHCVRLSQTFLERKLCVLSHTRIYLAIENSGVGDGPQSDYITEKFFQSLCSTAVVVYMGSAAYQRVTPATGAAVVATDFKSPKELAKFLQMLLDNPRLYDRQMDWRSSPVLFEGWRKSYYNRLENLHCRICDRIHNERGANIVPSW
eukprot:m51a1_g5838 putative alpha-( )-fucosyltransferase 11 (344) ;mRNA; r:299168-300436